MIRSSNRTARREERDRSSSFIFHPSSFILHPSSPTPDPRPLTPALAPDPRPLNAALSPESRPPTPALSPDPRPLTPAGFTLVELLIVITIIGMLAALISVAAVRAISTGRNAQITTEIGLLDAAMQTYKNDSGGAYPPDFTLLSTPNPSPPNVDVLNRQNRILAHFRKAFPRLIVPGGYGSTPNPNPGTLQWMSQQMYSQAISTYTVGGATAQFSNTKAPNGFSTWGDIDNLDPGEAMVFWLGGFAIPYQDQTGKWTYKLVGFSSNKVGNASSSGPNASGPNSGFGPFNLDVASRDMGPFEFNVGRLGDADGDGWPEYYSPVGDIPQPTGSLNAPANPAPPYVYFDAISYGSLPTGSTSYPSSAVYPSPMASSATNVPSGYPGAQPIGYSQSWGVALPYVQTIAGSGNLTWVNPQKYQIISAGIDQMYWYTPATTLLSNLQLRLYPSGNGYSQGDLDNLTNFTSSTLKSAQP